MLKQCIGIGASAGGFEILKRIVSEFPQDLPVSVFIVMHVSPQHHSYLPEILDQVGSLSAIHPADGTKSKAGVIYVAPPDHHLLVDADSVAVKRGPKENGFRPSIDALFRSVAYSYGPGAIGVVLSGALHDGTSGLWSIKRLGGIAVVQNPHEAEYASMPRSALEYVDADYQVKSTEIAALLVQLVKDQVPQEMELGNNSEDSLESRIAKEVQIAAGTDVSHKGVLELGELTPFTCPECQGVLVHIKEGNLSRFRCHTGHGFTADALLEAAVRSTGETIWKVTRGLQETEMLLEHIGHHIQEAGDSARAQKFFAKAHELGKRANQIQQLAVEHENLSNESVEEQQPADD